MASYNLRYENNYDGNNSWQNRVDLVKELISYHEFEIMATQELYVNQINDLLNMEGWSYVGVGRDDGINAGEHSAIFYRNDLFKVVDSGNFWLSETPDKPSKGWDATCCNRICTWAKFRQIKTDSVFYVFNVHFDHIGKTARIESGYLMSSKIKAIAGNSNVILCGDFNSTPDTRQIKHISSVLSDAFLVSEQKPYGPVGTFNDFKFVGDFDERIDYVFVSKGITIKKYAVLTDSKYNRYPSDHTRSS